MKRLTHTTLIIFAIAIPFIGYAAMHLFTYVLPLSETATAYQLLYTLVLIALGLLIPLAILKVAFHAARLRHPGEKEFTVRDIPKDKDQLAR